MEGKYEGLQSTPLHKQHLFARDKESIVRAFTYFRDERKAGRVVVKGQTITIVANMFGCAPSTVQKVLDDRWFCICASVTGCPQCVCSRTN